jgi:predicted dehydrogenase
MGKLRIGVVGCGYWGPNLIRNFTQIQEAKMVAVADLRDERLRSIKSMNNGITLTNDYHELFDMNLDGLVVATPPKTHFNIAREALEQGLNVMVEKPLTTSSPEAEQLIELAARKGLVLMVGHTFVYNNAVRALKKLIQSGEIGKIHYIDSARLSLGLYQPGLNVLWDLAPHDLSILDYLLEKDPQSVEVFGTSCVLKNTHDLVHLNLIFPENILAHIHISWLAPVKVREITVVGSKKMVVYNDIDLIDRLRIYDKGVEPPEYTSTYAEWQCGYRQGDVVVPNIHFVEPLRQECQHFLDCINERIPCMSSGEDGLKVIKIIEIAQKALIDGYHEEVLTW